jgi:hypothetical protein
MEKITKTDVRKSFKNIREIMRQIENELAGLDKQDSVYLEEGSYLGQIGMELIAESSLFDIYRQELERKARA